MPVGQKRTQDLILDGCELPYGRWELNSGPLEEPRPVLLTSESFLQPQVSEILIRGLFVT